MRKFVVFLALMVLIAIGASGSAALTTDVSRGTDSATEQQGSVASLPAGSWISGLQVQNLSGVAATLVVDFYNASGGTPVYSTSGTAPGNGSTTFYLPSLAGLPNGRYSAIVSSDQPVAVVANQVNGTPGMDGDSYLGVSAGATSQSLPLAFRNYSGGNWNSLVSVQNTSSSATANVNLYFYPTGQSTSALTKAAVIPAGASAYFDVSTAEYSALGSFVGSILVTSDQPVASNIQNFSSSAIAMFSGVTSEATSYVAPLVYDRYGGANWISGIMVLNKGGTPTNVTMVFKPSAGATGTYTKIMQIPGNSSGVFYMPNFTDIPAGTVGSATVTSDGNPIVVVVNSVSGNMSTGYNAFPASSGTAKIIAPLVFNQYSGGNVTGVQVYNMGGSSTTVQMTFIGTNVGGSWSNSISVAPGTSQTFYMPTFAGPPPGTYGSAVITSSGGAPIVAIVNTVKYPGNISSYTGINVTP